jgi:SAM-dependent methyltransferase
MEEDRQFLCLNLGCGNSFARPLEKNQTWVNIDREKRDGVDVVADLEDGLPMYEDGSVDLIVASHVMEHIKNYPQLMAECYRVLRPRGVLHIRTPAFPCRAAVADPTHYNYFVPESWLHFASNADIGFDTLGMRGIGFILLWNETIEWRRPAIDDGRPGAYFTENIVEFEKDGPFHEWEVKMVEVDEAVQKEKDSQ